MTNQVNQAFEKWAVNQKDEHNLPYFTVKLANGKYADALTTHAWKGYQASTQAIESEINSLKQRVEELESEVAKAQDMFKFLCIDTNIEQLELTESNNQLREALSKYVPKKAYKDNGKWFVKTKQTTGYVECEISEYADALDAIASNPEKSLAKHDNEVLVEALRNLMNDISRHDGNYTFEQPWVVARDTLAAYDKQSVDDILEKSLAHVKTQLDNYMKLSEVKHGK